MLKGEGEKEQGGRGENVQGSFDWEKLKNEVRQETRLGRSGKAKQGRSLGRLHESPNIQ